MIEMFLPSNCYSKRQIKSVDGAVIHFISAKNIDPEDPFNRDKIINILKDYKFSAHYLIERDGTRIKLVPGLHKAYHAGKSIMNGRESCNSFTIGIELVGGTQWDYTDAQIAELIKLLIELTIEYDFDMNWVQGHDEVRRNWNDKYPDNKEPVKVDPGDKFPWYKVQRGVAPWTG